MSGKDPALDRVFGYALQYTHGQQGARDAEAMATV